MKAFALLLLLSGMARSYTYKNCYRHYQDNTAVSCRNLAMRELQDAVGDLPNDILSLDIRQNNIECLPGHGFANLSALSWLSLGANQISEVMPAAFQALSNLSFLNLSSNRLEALNSGAFQGLGNLTSLILSNNSLSSFSPEVLQPLIRLRFLDISMNRFSNFSLVVKAVKDLAHLGVLVVRRNQMVQLEASGSLPRGLYNLVLAKNSIAQFRIPRDFLARVQKLDVSYNNISEYQALTTLNLSRLLYLDVKGNPLAFQEVKNLLRNLDAPVRNLSLCFMNLTQQDALRDLCGQLRPTVRYLKLEWNQFEKVSGLMDGCNKLTQLDLSNNEIRVPDLFTYGVFSRSLRQLLLIHNKINTIQFCKKGPGADTYGTCLPNLQYLSLQYNHLSSVPARAFQHFSNLTNLSLTVNEIYYISSDAFQGLSSLQFLALSHNAIGQIFPDIFSPIPQLRSLKLRNNRISVLHNSTFSSLRLLKALDLGGNNIKRIEADTFVGLHSLKGLYLDRNRLESLSSAFFQDLGELEVLDLDSNRLKFNSWHLQDPPFVHLGNLRMLKLDSQQPCRLNLLPYNLFSKLHNLKRLVISGNRFSTLGTMPFQELGNLTQLDMSDISIGNHILHNKTFQGLSNLRLLNMKSANLWGHQLIIFQGLKRLRTLILTSNMIHTIPGGSWKELPTLRYLDLRYNSLGCTCENVPFQKWALGGPVQVVLYYHYRCSATTWVVETLASFNETVCNIDLGFLAFCCTGPVLLCCLLGSVAYTKGKWYFKYGFYLLQAWLREAQLHHGKVKAHRYDAFVSYNAKDAHWVVDLLLPRLEEEGPPHFKLCLHQRDFEAGRPVVTNIVDAIYSSRKTLCIISRNYLASEWCSMEVQVALYRLFDERRDVLLLIFLDDLPDRALSAYTRVRKMARRTTYLKWPTEPDARRLFWAKLREALRPPVSDSLAGEEGSPLLQDI